MSLNSYRSILANSIFLELAHFASPGKLSPCPNSFSNLSFLPFFFLFIFSVFERVRDREGAQQPASLLAFFLSPPIRPKAQPSASLGAALPLYWAGLPRPTPPSNPRPHLSRFPSPSATRRTHARPPPLAGDLFSLLIPPSLATSPSPAPTTMACLAAPRQRPSLHLCSLSHGAPPPLALSAPGRSLDARRSRSAGAGQRLRYRHDDRATRPAEAVALP